MKYRLQTALSYLPNWVINWLIKHWKLHYDPTDGWTFWLDVSYEKWCRNDVKNECQPQLPDTKF